MTPPPPPRSPPEGPHPGGAAPGSRVAVIGLGYFSQFHLAGWQAQAGVRIVGAVDPDPDRRRWAEETFGLRCHGDVDGLLAAADPEILDIVAPPPTHAALISRLARPGRLIVCQKPFCRDLAEAEAVTAAAEKAGATLVIHENFRFQPWHRAAKRFLDSGDMGTVWQCRFALRPGDGRGPGAYLDRQPAFRTMPRLLVHETGVHFIDLFRWFFGDIARVFADLRRLNPALAGEDAGLLLLEHASGVRTVLDGNRLADHVTDNPRRTMGEMTVEGEGGCLRLDGAGRLWFRPFGTPDERPVPVDGPVDEASFGGGCVAALIAHVLAGWHGAGAYQNLARDYLPVIRATEAAYRAARTGCAISLPSDERA